MNPKRRWFLCAIVLLVVAVGVPILAFRREGPAQLVVLSQSEQNGETVVHFRFLAPKHTGVILDGAAILTRPAYVAVNWGAEGDPQNVWVRAGAVKEFSVIAPKASIWQLGLHASLKGLGRTAFRERVLAVLRTKRLSSWNTAGLREVYVNGPWITNGVPNPADAF